jgi:hypothetical protein
MSRRENKYPVKGMVSTEICRTLSKIKLMRRLFFFLSMTIFFIACKNDQAASIDLLAKPASPDAVYHFVKGKKFDTKHVATLSPFAMDSKDPYEWMDEKKDTSQFSRDYLKERMAFSLHFINDTSITIHDDGKTIDGTYKFDNEISDDEKEGVKLRVSYPDSSMSFPGMSGPMIMTATYFIAGADEKNLLLETPRSFNNRRIVVIMQAK